MKLKHLLGPLPNVTASGLVTVLFTLFFIGLCLYVFQRKRRPLYAHLERLPLEQEE